ncbi:TPA: hypothetical protein ACN37B_004738 [Vibrio parahaemolyticus]|uniref:hypothetical protein n=1 Tax=Vibrio parahaemolyticus TaxID=670 RepID=UPI001300F184|nr:hypothetical protein [Vibrio parahaemolyticus]EGQ7915192.1 hypothetical protein [Vibrio parahaemolyticus]EHB9912160.1 hypothetical protein [Vibrio parahaemolyticus]EHK6028865.1 hypothetical protein [Vibrio parahaemolyticus]EIA1798026.1 hypothetical protein [Vibrio parahaemolyticus]EIE1212776.1 hypothetical protein [Vibrio parahaemolyticus]
MKPLGTNNAAENELTTPKSAFGKLISQCGLSTNSTSRVSAKKFNSVNPKIVALENKSTVETMPILAFHHAS